jgi:hypothetical protein
VSIIKKTESELAEEREKRKKEYAKITDKEFNEAKKKNLKLGEITKERRALLDSLTPEKKKYIEKMFSFVQNMNGSKNKAEMIKVTEEFSEFDDRC